MHGIVKGSARPTLPAWRAVLAETDDCPYVGPRPQIAGRDDGMLIGRSQDIERINKAVIARSLVVLDGDSGVGKSSLLANGLYARLKKSGFGVFVNRKWTKSAPVLDTDAEIDRYIADSIQRTHEESGMPIPEAVDLDGLSREQGLCAMLDAAYRGTAAVLILDQFEELLRQHGEIAEKIVRWIIDVGFRYRTRVIISLRTDSVYRLDPLLRGIKPFSMDRVQLEEIEEEAAIRKVIETSRNARANAQEPSSSVSVGTKRAPITEEAVDGLLALWREHRPKLLDLQATLYALYFRARARGGEETDVDGSRAADVSQIEPGEVDRLVADARRLNVDNPFALGLRDSIRLKIEHAEDASRSVGIDAYLLSGTLEVVKRLAPLLSSGDFKVPVHQFDLAQRALARELRVLERALIEERELVEDEGSASPRRAAVITGEIVDTLFDALLRSRDFLAVQSGDIPYLATLLKKVATPGHVPSHRNVTAGPMMHRTATATLLEEVRRVAFAVQWLEATEIARKDPDGTLLLVHDRSGEAMTAWVDAQRDEPGPALRQLTGARGEHYVWIEKKQGIGNFDPGTAGYQVIANLSWRECRISTHFRRVVFVNCDFSGSRFERCTFEGVTFVNCLLDDVNFEYCMIRGRSDKSDESRIKRQWTTDEDEGRKTRLAPSFTVEAPADEVRHFAPYLEGIEDTPPQFFSDTSGVAAVPGPQPIGHPGKLLAHFLTTGTRPARSAAVPHRLGDPPVEASPTTGGVAMLGGRLCFLTLYRCSSEKSQNPESSESSESSEVDGCFALHHVSGGGFDIVEHYGGTIDIHDGAIRGISVTRDKYDAADLGESPRTPEVKLTVHDSLVVNIYFADELAGSADFQNAIVLLLINGSDNAKFGVRIQNCRYQFLVNTDEPNGNEDSRELRPPEALPYFERIEGTHSRFRAPNRGLLASDLEAMDYRSRPELWEESQRNGGGARNELREGVECD